MKTKLLGLISSIILLSPVLAGDKRYSPNTLIASNAVTVAATAGTNVNLRFDVPDQASVPLQIEAMADANGAYTLTVPVQYSVDGQEYANMAARSIAISFNGVTKQTIVTNVPTFGCAYLRIPHLTNATASINVTNIIVKSAISWSAPSPVN